MNILKSSAVLAFMTLAISSCGDRSAKDSNHSGNAELVNEQLHSDSQPTDSLKMQEVTET